MQTSRSTSTRYLLWECERQRTLYELSADSLAYVDDCGWIGLRTPMRDSQGRTRLDESRLADEGVALLGDLCAQPVQPVNNSASSMMSVPSRRLGQKRSARGESGSALGLTDARPVTLAARLLAANFCEPLRAKPSGSVKRVRDETLIGDRCAAW